MERVFLLLMGLREFLEVTSLVGGSCKFLLGGANFHWLPARASEQGNVIGLVSVYLYICVQIFFVIERTRDLIYLNFVATDFSPKIINPSAGENSGDSA